MLIYLPNGRRELKLSATYILLPQQPNLNVIERKFKRQILKPDPIILVLGPSP